MKLGSHLRRIGRNEDGVTLIEFAFAAPVFIMMLMALFDMGFQIYAQSVLQGAVQNAARASTIEGNDPDALDSAVRDNVQEVIPGATVTFTRTAYANFEDIGIAEDFTDTAGAEDGICNNGEPFEDVNGNGIWDADRGVDGAGGARDAVLYSATATFDRVFPFHEFVGLAEEITIEGATVLRNQPFNDLDNWETTIENCT
ncbi:TadE/TadG family type IV pilus assembly protein [Parerythrobacter aestuarii]|uniref:TadE/TadG family type IV pilus assembly protein n=1 Tax=Parerythrobacter aestuarii TaxID=3020909 RepID=UPI0024DE3A4B|nr:TadE family protein [Parerythrobacter aestuarii]